ncbi:MAG: helix-hairpin-helix domain-containing protein [Candidatus Wallbacteria bacterium]|nr:helix-hairpin-helix domain-containing protein [Candidatus Wallbacteria bacterium]
MRRVVELALAALVACHCAAVAGPVNVNGCTYSELLSLPGVGPRLAEAILDEHARAGDYRGPGDLLRVPGIGPVLVRRLTALVDFGEVGPVASVRSSRATTEEAEPIDINVASKEQLCLLDGIGPVLAGRIVDYRQKRGPFRAVGEMAGVKGVGRRAARLGGRITVGRQARR